MKVAIDVGHARMTGARGNGQEEHDLCARMAPLLKAYLEEAGVQADVIDFPDLDNRGDLAATVRAINAGGYDASVSLHCDASDHAAACGAHVCYVSQRGEKLARAIAEPLCALLPGRAQRVVRRGDLYVLKHTVCPAVLAECGFITNEGDCHALVHEPGRLMRAVADGLKEFLS